MHGGPVGRSTEPGCGPPKISRGPQMRSTVVEASFARSNSPRSSISRSNGCYSSSVNKRTFALIDGRNFIHQIIGWLRTFLTENKSNSVRSNGLEPIPDVIGRLRFDLTLMRIKTLIFDQVWTVQASSDSQKNF